MYWRVLRHVVKRPAFSNLTSWCQSRCYSTKSPQKTSKPLRILFCGSDEFSSTSLRGLYEEHRRNPELIASIDVLCRPGKPSGRNLKAIREVPIKAVAQELGLPVHERDTFTGWNLPNPYNEPINLIIAVSFGLFVPPRILKSVEYGGLNVHPSILPDFRGPAPLHYTIMTGKKYTGVTLQTLDESSFDSGVILAQTPPNGLAIPFDGKCTYQQLLNYINPIAAAILVQGLQDRVFVPPHANVGWLKTNPARLTHAKKITAADKMVNWREHSGITIERHFRALGRLWSNFFQGRETTRRVVFEDMEIVSRPESIENWMASFRGKRNGPIKPTDEEKTAIHFAVMDDNGYRKPRFYVVDGEAVIFASQSDCLRVKKITVEGKGKQDAAMVMKGFKDWGEWKIRSTNRHIVCVHKDENMARSPWKSTPPSLEEEHLSETGEETPVHGAGGDSNPGSDGEGGVNHKVDEEAKVRAD